MSTVKVAATQIACSDDYDANLAQAEELVREAASKGANIILLQELFAGLYFCQEQTQANFKHAEPADGPIVQKFSALAAELGVVLPISFFEKANNAYYNSLVVIDADGSVLDLYRKSHMCVFFQARNFRNPPAPIVACRIPLLTFCLYDCYHFIMHVSFMYNIA